MEEKRPGDLCYNNIFLNVSSVVIFLYCCISVFQLCVVSLKKNVKFKMEKWKRTNKKQL